MCSIEFIFYNIETKKVKNLYAADIFRKMSNVSNLEQQIANLQINHGDGIKTIKSGKKVGPAVPPKPKKSQPQVSKSIEYNNNYVTYSITIFHNYDSLSMTVPLLYGNINGKINKIKFI